jgi:predicted PurR-regulated permease PerM
MPSTKLIFWGSLAIILGFFVHSVSDILSPFIASMIIAYFLDPLTLRFEKIGIKRYLTVLIIVGLFVALMITSLIKLIPALLEQIQQFIHEIPRYEQYVSTKILNQVNNYSSQVDPKLAQDIQQQLSGLSTKFFGYTATIIRGLFNSSIAVLNVVGLVLFTPILVFYLLKDWPSVVKHFNKLLPLSYKKVILEQLKQIDKVLSAYIRGQISVCLILSVFYVVSLGILGLDYYLLVGIIAGFLTVIPFLGLIIGAIICTVVALLQYSELHYVYTTLAIFVSGHILETYLIVPKLIGEKVGLHPVWVIFSLMAGGALFGFWGVFFAIPIAAITAEIIRSLIKIYLASQMYNR